MKLIDNATKAWRMFSVQAMTIANAALGSWLMLPDKLQSAIPVGYVVAFAMLMLALGTIGRLVKQDKVSGNGS